MKYRCMHPVNEETRGESGFHDIFSRLVKERILFLCEEINAEVATSIAATLLFLDLENQEKEITLYINSQGGSIEDGLHTIYDTLQCIKSPVKTICIGEAYSSAAVLLASGTKGLRFAYPSARVMIHMVQVEEMSGNQKEIEEESRRIKKLNQSLLEIMAKHTGQSLKKVKRDCNKDKYFSAEEALKYGLIDHIMVSSKSSTDKKM